MRWVSKGGDPYVAQALTIAEFAVGNIDHPRCLVETVTTRDHVREVTRDHVREVNIDFPWLMLGLRDGKRCCPRDTA